MKQKLLAIALTCALLTGCGAAPTPPLTQEPIPQGEPIAYVPLDDRPDNEERVIYLAESLGYVLKLPERDLYRTRLNGQPLNENGTQFGDRGALYEWVLEQEAQGCNRYVLFLDQLLSGGLVNSRAMAESRAVTLSDGRVMTEAELLAELLDVLASDPENRVWLLDSVMRLAPTVGYQHWTLEEYNALRAYGMEGRPILTGEALTPKAIRADYRLSSQGTALAPEDFGLDEAEVEEYLHARSRKLSLTAQMMTALETMDGAEQFRVLIGIDDSSEEDSIQKNEIAFLRSLLREGDALLSGVDDLAFKAVTALYLDEMEAGQSLRERGLNHIYVEYFGGMEDQPACAYDYQPLETIVEEHLDFFGLERSDDPLAAEIQLLVLTQPAEESRKEADCRALAARLRENQAQRLPTIVIDAGNGQYGTQFHQILTKEAELGWLLSYAGFLDMAIVTGTALSHGLARYAYLVSGENEDTANRAFARTLADSVIKDFCYKHIVREELLHVIRTELGGSPDNFWSPEIDREAVLERLEQGMEKAAAPAIRNLQDSNLIVSLEDYQAEGAGLAGWGGIALENYRFPWDRAFEIGMDIRLGEWMEPHRAPSTGQK